VSASITFIQKCPLQVSGHAHLFFAPNACA
jgi:hypothetical protein